MTKSVSPPSASGRYPLLDNVNTPEDVRALPADKLPALTAELRDFLIRSVAKTGGHLGAGLGVAELTVALHYMFDTPRDKLIWDVGHQAYPHKILTGRKDRMHTLRQEGGLSGFTKRSESVYDPFGAGHSSTSISAALGMAAARDAAGADHEVIAVIGDGALSAGMAYEALNNAGALRKRLIVILNDNDMSISPAVGAMNGYLNRIVSSSPYRTLRKGVSEAARFLPPPFRDAGRAAERFARDIARSGNGLIFEEMGFSYTGPVNGHDIPALLNIFSNIRNARDAQRPFFVHVITEKGRGFAMEDKKREKLHAVGAFDADSAAPLPAAPAAAPTYTKVFADTLIKLAEKDPAIVAVTAAMPSGTGTDAFAKRFPDRFFDVGIAEQHAVTFSAGMAAEGLKPFCAIYSTFLQRGYDQIVHDAVLQKLPVRFMIDRAGLVGADGATHAGVYDNAFLGCLPDIVLMAPADEAELARMIATAAVIDDRPCAVRYPRGEGTGAALPETPEPLEIGKGRVISEGERAAILSYGDLLPEAVKAAEIVREEHGFAPAVIDARFMKPLDEALIADTAKRSPHIFTLESGAPGGFGAAVARFLALCTGAGGNAKITPLTLPDMPLDHGSPAKMYDNAGLSGRRIADVIAAACAG